MDPVSNYIEINKALWDAKTKHHTGAAFYKMDEFLKGASSLNPIELGLLGDVKGKSILHLQCHFGQDSLSLARMGARVTGVDFSEAAIKKARELNEQLGLDAEFICSDVYKLPGVLSRQFDIVYTSYGVLGWLPDMKKWAEVVSHFIKPGGEFILVEFHPVVWMFSYDFSTVQYSYFNKEAIVEVHEGTYADRSADMKQTEIGWNHDLSEVMQNLLDHGLHITTFREYDTSPYNCFQNMVETAPGAFRVRGLEGKIPLVYSVKAVKS
jgi:2-polyprenyl-3-methyl-5-hydroxy-6-metoxy-1,4-benzoquinol methylase